MFYTPVSFRPPRALAAGLVFLCANLALRAAEPDSSPAPGGALATRQAEIAAALGERPYVPGGPIDDRPTWERLAKNPSVAAFAIQAETDLREPTPILTPQLFEEVRVSDKRALYELPFRQRSERLSRMTIAECLENKGRFLSAIETEFAAMLAEPTWTVPDHWNRHGGKAGLDAVTLESTARVATLAVVDGWLGARLRPELRADLRRKAEERVLRPYLVGVRSGSANLGVGWMNWPNNWNAVCHAGTVGAALMLVEDRMARAEFVAAAEQKMKAYLGGFTADGYCSEGMAYWLYGFGSYLYLSETVREATGGKVDWLRQGERASLLRNIATYPARLELYDQLYPTYADGSPGLRPSGWMLDLVQRRLQLGRSEWLLPEPAGIPLYHPLGATLLGAATVMFLDRAPESADAAEEAAPSGAPLRDEFTEGQVFTFRPAPGDPRFGAGFKGGHNQEHHNHNDVGSFVVASGGDVLLVDPGTEQYTARTFSPRRYESRVIASYGHSVPLVAGKEQPEGRRFAAKVIERSYSDSRDAVTLDMTAAYDVPALETLTRGFVFTRGESPSFVVTDTARFSSPQTFGTALVTFSKIERRAPDRILFYERKSAVEAVIDTGGAAFTITDELLDENLPSGLKARRIGINLNEPATGHVVTVTIRPAEPPPPFTGAKLPDGVGIDAARDRVRIEAERFDRQSNGSVEVVARVAASGLGFRNWDKAGHAISWKFVAPKAGRYAIRLRYALGVSGDSARSALIDGKTIVPADNPSLFPGTGGWSSEGDNWSETWLGQGAEAVLVDLTAGVHTLTLSNEKGALNLDWIELAPVAP